jgi:3-oxoacyl-[acyl-carrier protein] reductase
MQRKKALVTGASRGIGEAIALRLAKEGFNLELAARNEARLQAVAAACTQLGAETGIYVTDVADEQNIIGWFARAAPFDLLVNNAGEGCFARIEDVSLEDWRSVQRTNVEGAFLCIREAMKSMQTSGGGRIINIASVVGVKGYPQQAAYGASKHALLGLTKTAIEEGREHNIRVHAICPGGVATEMVRNSRPDLTDFSAMIQPADVADAVAYLCALPMNITVDVIHLRRAAGDQSW